jgi:hypothetical protein
MSARLESIHFTTADNKREILHILFRYVVQIMLYNELPSLTMVTYIAHLPLSYTTRVEHYAL